MTIQADLQAKYFEDNKTKFFACSDQDMQEYYAAKEANKPIDPKLLVK